MQSVQACFAALTPDAGSFPVPSFDAGSFPMPSFDAGAFPPFPDGGLQPPPFPDGGAFPSSACFDKINACFTSKDPQSCLTQAMSCLQGQ